jgi:hypothetical protein
MESIWMAIAPRATSTRVLAMAGASETIMKARLSRAPSHPRAMATLLEAIALRQGLPVRAALAADAAPNGIETSLYRDAFSDGGGPLYSIDWVPGRGARKRATRDLGGMGAFADLRQLVLFEVAR